MPVIRFHISRELLRQSQEGERLRSTGRSFPASLVRLGLMLLLLLPSSCQQSGPALGQVQGMVTLDGKPLPRAVITFYPTGESGTTSTAMTDDSGHFALKYSLQKFGAFVGHHDVKIEYRPPTDGDGNVIETPGQPIIRLPAKYSERGTLNAEVQAGAQKIDFALSSTEE